MTRSIACVSFAAAASIMGCAPIGEDEVDQFRNGVPRAATVTMSVPGSASSGQALTVESQSQALLGEKAEWYQTTRNVTVGVNGGAWAVGALVNLILKYPPTSLVPDEAVWGPWEDPLDPVAWKVTITRVGPHVYQYKFEGRPRTDPTAAFVIVLSGTHRPALNLQDREIERFGSGSFTLDWDARATLPQPPDDNVGKADYTYQHTSAANTVSITAQFDQVKDDKQPGNRVDANYAFAQQPRGPGSMDFVYVAPTTATQVGRGVVRSRWQFTGDGRADVQITDGTTVLYLSECWDQNYASVYKQDSWPGGDSWGVETSCASPTVEYSTLL